MAFARFGAIMTPSVPEERVVSRSKNGPQREFALTSLPAPYKFRPNSRVSCAADFRFRLYKVLAGAAITIPALGSHRPSRVGQSVTASRCYGLWLRHVARLHEVSPFRTPRTMVELGPGDSLGTGIAALLSGVERVYALDAFPLANAQRDARLVDEIAKLFHERAPVPATHDACDLPHLDELAFPSHVFPAEVINRALQPERIASIRACLKEGAVGDGPLIYIAPWRGEVALTGLRAQLVLSHSVLEYVDNLREVYTEFARWTSEGGFMSHFLDYSSIGYALQWDGHWSYSDIVWRLVRGRREYVVNRIPHAEHLRMLAENGFEILGELRYTRPPTISRNRLASRFQSMTDEDRETHFALIVSRARPAGGVSQSAVIGEE